MYYVNSDHRRKLGRRGQGPYGWTCSANSTILSCGIRAETTPATPSSTKKGKFILNLLPSGILRETTVNVMGNGMVIDLEHLVHEIENLRRGGIAISPRI